MILLRNLVFSKKNYMTFKEAMRYGPCAGRKQSTERIPGVAGMLDFADKELKSAIVNLFKNKRNHI